MATLDYMWLHWITCGYTGLHVATLGYMWLHQVYGYTGLHVATYGYIGLHTVCDIKKLTFCFYTIVKTLQCFRFFDYRKTTTQLVDVLTQCNFYFYECIVINYDKCKYKNPASNSANIVTSEAERRMVYSWYTKKRIIYYYEQGYRAPSIASLLLDEDIVASRVGIAKLLRRYEETKTIVRCLGSGRPTVITRN